MKVFYVSMSHAKEIHTCSIRVTWEDLDCASSNGWMIISENFCTCIGQWYLLLKVVKRTPPSFVLGSGQKNNTDTCEDQSPVVPWVCHQGEWMVFNEYCSVRKTGSVFMQIMFCACVCMCVCRLHISKVYLPMIYWLMMLSTISYNSSLVFVEWTLNSAMYV